MCIILEPRCNTLFGESERNIIAFVTITGSSYEKEEVDLKLPRKKIVYIDIEDIDKYPVPCGNDTIKLTVSGSYDQFKATKKTEVYRRLVESGVKVIFKPKKQKKTREETNQEGEVVEVIDEVQSSGTDFTTILSSMIMDVKNPYLVQAYDLVVNNKETDLEDVIFL